MACETYFVDVDFTSSEDASSQGNVRTNGLPQVGEIGNETIVSQRGDIDGAPSPQRSTKPEIDQRRTWRQWVRPVFVIAYVLFCCAAVPVLIWDMYTNEFYFNAYTWLTAGICALVAIGVSIFGILGHIVYFSRPNQQRYIVRKVCFFLLRRILLMVPIYSIDSSIALRVPKAAIFLDSIRACYQAFVVFCFLFYLLHYLHENYDLDNHLSAKPQMKSPKPFCCFKPGPNLRLVRRCRNGVLNFVIIGPLTTIISIFFYYMSDKYEEGTFTARGAWLWLNVISGISQVWAMYCLAIFYQATKEETRPLRPLPQMLCVKWAVFGAFFQQFIIALLVDTEVFTAPPEWEYTPNEFASEIQNFLICIEMAIVSVIHLFAFPHKPYKSGEPLPFMVSCKGLCDFSDMTTNVRIHSGTFIDRLKCWGKSSEDTEEIIKEGDMIMDDRNRDVGPHQLTSYMDQTINDDAIHRDTLTYDDHHANPVSDDDQATVHGVECGAPPMDEDIGLFGINASGNLNNLAAGSEDEVSFTGEESGESTNQPSADTIDVHNDLTDAFDTDC